MRISDWSSDVCSSDLITARLPGKGRYWQTRHLQMTALTECVKHAGSPATDLSGLAALPQRGCRLDRNGWPTGCGRAPRARRRTALCAVGRVDRDRKSTLCTPVTNAHIVCRLLLDKKNNCKY